MAQLDVNAAFAVSLRQLWERLAEVIAETKELEHEAKDDPALARDPEYRAHTRWVSLFQDELGAVQTVSEAVQSGVNVPAEQVLSARRTGKKLLELAGTMSQEMSEPAAHA
jgi:hypothetical protein